MLDSTITRRWVSVIKDVFVLSVSAYNMMHSCGLIVDLKLHKPAIMCLTCVETFV